MFRKIGTGESGAPLILAEFNKDEHDALACSSCGELAGALCPDGYCPDCCDASDEHRQEPEEDQ